MLFLLLGSETIEKYETQERGTHADEIETSMMMVIAPETVHLEKAVKDCNPNVPGPFVRFPPSDSSAGGGLYSPSGAWGDPTLASLEKGVPIVEAIVQYHLDRISALSSAEYVAPPCNERYLAPHRGYDDV